MLDVAIRRAEPSDAEAIADLISAMEPHLVVSEISRDERRDRFRWLLEGGYNVSFLAEAGGRLVGELTLALGNPNPTEIGFGVDRAWRRRGVGRALLEHAVAWADENGIHKLTAEVFPHNAAAVGLLRQAGFTEEAYLINQFRRKAGGANDAILLVRTAPRPDSLTGPAS